MAKKKIKLFSKSYLEVYDYSKDYQNLYNIFFVNTDYAGYIDNKTICLLVQIQEVKISAGDFKNTYLKLGRMIRKINEPNQIQIISEIFRFPEQQKSRQDWFIAKCEDLKLIYLPPIIPIIEVEECEKQKK
ncbi:MAG: hypothetical protein ACOVNU_03085 [Candidatus Kapaibacteriota bacterium]